MSSSNRVTVNLPLNYWTRHLLCISYPFWSFAAPLAAAALLLVIPVSAGIRQFTTHNAAPAEADLFTQVILSLAFFVLWAVCSFLWHRLADDSILFTDKGADFSVLPEGYEISWTEFQSLSLDCGSMSSDLRHRWMTDVALGGNLAGPAAICFGLAKKRIRLPIEHASRAGLITLFRAIDTMAQDCQMTEELRMFWDALEGNVPQTHVDSSFTQMWEAQMREHFSSSAYVPLLANEDVADYVVQKQIAMSALSAVYLVSDRAGEQFVLKECVIPENASQLSRQKALEMFEREAAILSRLNHPGLARIRDYFVQANKQYILMEISSGQTLKGLVLKEGAQHELKVIAWATQIAEILSYLHQQNPPVIHRDISPENVIVDSDGKITLVDFGAAREVLGTATGTVVGKLSFMAPEQFRGKAVTQSDIYGLGCLMQFLLTGKEPIPFSTICAQELPSTAYGRFGPLIEYCTQQNPGDRPADLSFELAHLLRADKNEETFCNIGT